MFGIKSFFGFYLPICRLIIARSIFSPSESAKLKLKYFPRRTNTLFYNRSQVFHYNKIQVHRNKVARDGSSTVVDK